MHELSQRILRVWRENVGPRILPLLTTVRFIGLMIAAFALWGFYEIAEGVLEQETQSLDTRILMAIRQWHTPFLDRLMVVITNLGNPSVLLVASLLLAAFLLWRKRRAETVTLAIAAIGALGLNVVLKDLFARSRPELWQRTVDVNFYSFPSGHAMMSVVVFGIIGYLLAAHLPRWRLVIATLTVLLVCAIGFSRLYFGVHWPTDIVAGYAAGTVWLVACILSLEIWKRRYRRVPSERQRSLTSAPKVKAKG
ncbi:phosphatase PAP2 family protein [Stenomitos frigidus]|uniref:Phosphatidic acid phosphatase n=1 Tax=Stenomitos frigidus ULC18 TaxID=2107698 RepID=A0A2T1DW34_9CYAN|nr:phosphatase PAP2 family protein [Stenomitos frigidus]PSB24726.1 phosphatidic acid phosphatase [Stenomitos frigidus ULC18]